MQRRNTRQSFAIGIHFCIREFNALYGSAFGWIIGYLRGLRIQTIDRRLLPIRCRLQIGDFLCISINLSIQLSLCCSQCIRSGKISIRICFRVDICRIGFLIELVVYISLGVGIFNVISSKRVRFVHFAIHNSCKISQLAIQLADVSFIRSDVPCICRYIRRLGIREVSNLLTYLLVQFFSNFLRRQNLIYYAAFHHMHSCFRYAQSPTEERKRHERREKGTSSNPPDFFRSGSRLGMRASDFRRYHIAILCLGPDDFVNVVHDDFPLCEKQ